MGRPVVPPDVVSELVPGVDVCFFHSGGRQGSVYRCEINGNIWALKVRRLTGDRRELAADAVERASREVQALRDIDVASFATLGPIDLGRFDWQGRTFLYFSEEFIDGPSLAQTLHQSPRLPMPQLSRLALDLAGAIQALASRNRVHRDIKPDNVVSRSSGGYVLVDAGLVFDPTETPITEFGIVVGTLPYTSPEQLDLTRVSSLDWRSDQFAAGVVLYEATTGGNPFYSAARASDMQLIEAVLKHHPPHPSEVCGDVPRGWGDVVMQMLAKQRHLRFRSPRLMIQHIFRARHGE